MEFILGGTFKVSDTCGRIGMKLSGFMTLKLCNVIFSTHGERFTSGLDFRPDVENMTLHSFRVINPESFIPIRPRVSETLKVPPKMNLEISRI